MIALRKGKRLAVCVRCLKFNGEKNTPFGSIAQAFPAGIPPIGRIRITSNQNIPNPLSAQDLQPKRHNQKNVSAPLYATMYP